MERLFEQCVFLKKALHELIDVVNGSISVADIGSLRVHRYETTSSQRSNVVFALEKFFTLNPMIIEEANGLTIKSARELVQQTLGYWIREYVNMQEAQRNHVVMTNGKMLIIPHVVFEDVEYHPTRKRRHDIFKVCCFYSTISYLCQIEEHYNDKIKKELLEYNQRHHERQGFIVSFCGISSIDLGKALLDPSKFDHISRILTLRMETLKSLIATPTSCSSDSHIHLVSIPTLDGRVKSIRGSNDGLLVFSTDNEPDMKVLLEQDDGNRDLANMLYCPSIQLYTMPSFGSLAASICTDDMGIWKRLAVALKSMFVNKSSMTPVDIDKYNQWIRHRVVCQVFEDISTTFDMNIVAIIMEYAITPTQTIKCFFNPNQVINENK